MEFCSSILSQTLTLFLWAILERQQTFSWRQLKDFPRFNGVYVEKKERSRISDALFKTLKVSPPWPNDDEFQLFHSEKTESFEADNQDVDDSNKNSKRLEKGENACFRSQKKDPVVTLSKAYYSGGYRYSGLSTENFKREFTLFQSRCDQAGIREEDRPTAFSIMLWDTARILY